MHKACSCRSHDACVDGNGKRGAKWKLGKTGEDRQTYGPVTFCSFQAPPFVMNDQENKRFTWDKKEYEAKAKERLNKAFDDLRAQKYGRKPMLEPAKPQRDWLQARDGQLNLDEKAGVALGVPCVPCMWGSSNLPEGEGTIPSLIAYRKGGKGGGYVDGDLP